MTALAGVAGVAVALATTLMVGPADAMLELAGLMPTSGGTLWNDPDARGGVNDGDNEVAASERPESVGFTQSEIYLDSDRPSLYDAFNEMYGEPYKPRELPRMIALGPNNIREQKERPAENLRAGREFPLVRRKPQAPRTRPGERAAQALVYVKGPTPVHLALMAYDVFDGRTWREEPATKVTCPLELEPGAAWIRMAWPPRAILAGSVSHQVKIGTLDSSNLPLPPHVTRFRVGSVNRTDFFGWAQLGILRMLGRTVPAGTVIESEAQTVAPRRLSAVDFTPGYAPARLQELGGGAAADPRLVALGRSWVRGAPAGWAQVEAIVAAVRRHAALDRTAVLPADCTDAVAYFLFDARRGPDVQFATATVVLLRLLGYPARVVSGLYAGPERYDPRTRHTPLTQEDVHFWAEVIGPGGIPIAIEPTPGYELMPPRLPWTEQLVAVLVSVRDWACDHPGLIGVALLGLTAACRFRREALDVLATTTWALRPRRDERDCVLATLKLLERRLRWVGHARPPDRTLAHWYAPITVAGEEGAPSGLGRLVRLAEWVLYAPQSRVQRPPWDETEIRATCRHVVRVWTLGRLRTATRSTPGPDRERRLHVQ
jgi:transglutaminase-like putative cysteine protease